MTGLDILVTEEKSKQVATLNQTLDMLIKGLEAQTIHGDRYLISDPDVRASMHRTFTYVMMELEGLYTPVIPASLDSHGDH